ncbi:MAG: Endonuclease NucS, partial [uncultured Nocardioidaceae bacterium]
ACRDRQLPGRLRGQAHRPPPDGHPADPGQERRLGAGALRRWLLQAPELDVAAVQGRRADERGRCARVGRDRQAGCSRGHLEDRARRGAQRRDLRPRRGPRTAEGRRRAAPPGAARRAPRHLERGAHPGAPGVPDGDRTGGPDVSRHIREVGGCRDQAPRRDRRCRAADQVPRAAQPRPRPAPGAGDLRCSGDPATGEGAGHRPRDRMCCGRLQRAARHGRPHDAVVL